jgi:DNA-directed RNA polymerase specialized sigma24 family protein
MAGRRGEQTSYTAYVDARWAALCRVAHLLMMDATEAEELLQATLVKAYVRWERVSAATSVDSYVRRMMLDELLGEQRLRARRRGKAHLIPVAGAVATDDPIDRLDLWDHLSALPPSAPSWCCATTRTCPRPRSPTFSAARGHGEVAGP